MNESQLLKKIITATNNKHSLIIGDDNRLYKIVSLTADPVLVIEGNEDEMEIVLECPNCKKPTKYGEILMVSGVVGCSNEITPGKHCYFDDVLPREFKEREGQ